jgi:putative transposase
MRKARYHGLCFPAEVIGYSVWAYHRFVPSIRDLEDLLAELGVFVSYESIGGWRLKVGSRCQRSLKRREGQLGDHWHTDEVFVAIQGQVHDLWRAVDPDGTVLDILVRHLRDAKAAKRFSRKFLKEQGEAPRRLFSDGLGSYRVAARELLPGTPHDTSQYANNRVEPSRQATRGQERQMGRFKSGYQAQRLLSLHARANNLFRYGRHLLRAANHKLFLAGTSTAWHQVTCA